MWQREWFQSAPAGSQREEEDIWHTLTLFDARVSCSRGTRSRKSMISGTLCWLTTLGLRNPTVSLELCFCLPKLDAFGRRHPESETFQEFLADMAARSHRRSLA